ncbi:MAG TPA: NAD-dependent epimerase/dehydratase family protein, partial [Acetobacteraceae bacterium]|nr:NAD-dependent epimerase/dehydratase family protein [Acetobacteraceae bacterium]
MRRVCLIGAGNIARTHAEALRSVRGVSISAIVDPRLDAAREIARLHGAPRVFPSLAEALADDAFDAAHALVPPDRHAEVTRPLLQAGRPVLVEKPLAASLAECELLLGASQGSGTALGVNQNFVFHPAFLELQSLVERRALGRPDFVDCLYSMPLRQLETRQFGHWMFQAPGNILLEQAVHPLSQICRLAGEVQELRALAEPPQEIAPGVPFCASVTATLACDRLPAELRFALGRPFPFWQLSVLCSDGVIVADMLANRVFTYGRTKWLEAADALLSARRTAAGIRRAAWRNARDYGLSALGLGPRRDAFFLSMKGGIAAFHAALDLGHPPPVDGRFGAMLVGICERIRDAAFPPAAEAPCVAAPRLATQVAPDVAVLGGTGFIGTAAVRRLLEQGLRVAVMARSTRNLPALFQHERVALHRGDIRQAEDVRRATEGAGILVNLAHGGGGGSYAEIRDAMVGGAETVARIALEGGARRLIHVGSIASLYLGPQEEPVTGRTAPDPRAEERADYARAKAECDRVLLAMHEQEALPVVILRPGLVVGEGTSPLHGGLGFFNNEQHCVGWNQGQNPLPFVLVEDVAAAILGACRA